MPDENNIERFRFRLEKYNLAEEILGQVNNLLIKRGLLLNAGIVLDTSVIAASLLSMSMDHKPDPEMHSSKAGE